MVNIFKRIHKLRALLNVRIGPGAATLPSSSTATKDFPPITRLHLTYARKIYGGHQGARHFWRECLPRLKYYNPGVSMSVKQTTEQDGPATLTIYFDGEVSKTSSSGGGAGGAGAETDGYAPAATSTEKTASINLKDLDYQEIWRRVQAVTGASAVPSKPEEEAEMARYKALRGKAQEDRARVASIRQTKRDQERMLLEARGEVERLRQA
ncbi:hypothetical protein ASPZODRAFT_91556 [Penicilliopsis zonata CBS 506.65]|uniref:Ribosomal protein/NADH dehydrogenase domain-containing protein n=1 Tax=Penicilliopsis zonata CBS 506.65 TaxID=1073090 RepID=A0A1L9SPX6_9EURO|nr:hypothetical protein ASPZODRAFT_91556 [Penicilliopsis zonata CBS 506.65]OJJ49176.1 hypothetical protein ASPZODRAFT_91556 [Penicilliopsis zonata CBS 506.65]